MASPDTDTTSVSGEPRACVASLDGMNVHYTSYGCGRIGVVFIHGFACDATFWRLQVPANNQAHQVILDLPGHGKSEKPRIAYTQELLVRSVDTVLRGAGIEKAVLVGHSMGATVALAFARRYAGRLLGMVLADGALPSNAGGQIDAERFASRLPGLRGPDYVACEQQRIEQRFVPQTASELREEIRTKMLATPQHVMVSLMEGLAEPGTWDVTPVLTPTLIINAHDYRPQTDEIFLRGTLPALDFRNWHGVGHFVMMEKPLEFNLVLAQFVQSLGLFG